MIPETFTASRWTKGNRLFPTLIEVTDSAVVRSKRSRLTVNEIRIHLSKVARACFQIGCGPHPRLKTGPSVRIATGLLWADLLVESVGGSDPLASPGPRKADAQRIKEWIEASPRRQMKSP